MAVGCCSGAKVVLFQPIIAVFVVIFFVNYLLIVLVQIIQLGLIVHSINIY